MARPERGQTAGGGRDPALQLESEKEWKTMFHTQPG